MFLQTLIANCCNEPGREDVENHRIINLIPVTHKNCSAYTSNSSMQCKAHVEDTNMSVDNRALAECDDTIVLGYIWLVITVETIHFCIYIQDIYYYQKLWTHVQYIQYIQFICTFKLLNCQSMLWWKLYYWQPWEQGKENKISCHNQKAHSMIFPLSILV